MFPNYIVHEPMRRRSSSSHDTLTGGLTRAGFVHYCSKMKEAAWVETDLFWVVRQRGKHAGGARKRVQAV